MQPLIPKRWLTVRNLLLVVILLLVLLVLAGCASPSNPGHDPRAIVGHGKSQ